MRPLKLKMSAFGPYAGEETIDFTALQDKNIFLITGPTGAGKTTIFDGITFALYGRASGDERKSENFRSDFADEDRLTFVELWFEVKGKKYYIKRIPQQKKKKARGEGYTDQKSDAELQLSEEKVITGIKDVQEKINEIFGITYEQFKQIVMIPQGEFRELLSANSSEREIIFRKIFGTYSFRRVQELLEESSRELISGIKSFLEQRNTNIRNLQCGEDEEFENLKNAKDLNLTEILSRAEKLRKEDEIKRIELSEKIASIDEELNLIQKSIAEGVQINKKFQEKEILERKKQELEEKRYFYYNQEYLLNKARKAMAMQGKEEYYINRKNNVDLKGQASIKSEEALKHMEKLFLEAEGNIKAQEEKEEERKHLAAYIAEMNKDIDKVREYEIKKQSINEVFENLKLREKNKNDKVLFIEELKLNIDKVSQNLDRLKDTSSKLLEHNNHLKEKEEIKRKLDRLHLEDEKLTDIRNCFKNCRDKFTQAEACYKKSKEEFEYMDEVFRKGQAGILAEKLEENKPCPVCGALHHPSPAALIGGVPREEELKKSKVVYERNLEIYNNLLNELTRYKTQGISQKEVVDSIKEELKSFIIRDISNLEKEELTGFVSSEREGLNRDIELLKVKINSLKEDEKQLRLDTENLKKLKDKLIKEEKLLKDLDNLYLEAYGHYERESEGLRKLKEDIPEDISSLKALNEKINSHKNRLSLLEKEYKEAQSAFNKAGNDAAAARADRAVKQKEYEISKLELQGALNDFREAIKEKGFQDEGDYQNHKLKEEEIARIDKSIKDYNEEIKSTVDRFEEAIKNLEGLERVDISLIEQKHIDIKEKRSVLLEEDKKLFARMNNNQKLLGEIIKLQDVIKEKEESYRIIGELARVAKGDNNQRVSFERYVLAAYFDDIIEAANIRLLKMTSGRYLLSRIKEKGKGSAQQGLELEVYDNYTGKARHVKTLSGGESFKASLSMALGLADVVQSYSGGISLETMFVDEGFGTLDPESLDNAISSLIELQSSGRLVGIISHVPELKERIDARLEITPGMQGSHAEFVL